MEVSAQACKPRLYRQRSPESTVLHRVVREHLETWLAHHSLDDTDGFGVPERIEREFRQYLTCGVLAHGFVRARCDGCGHDILIAFSCKGRGLCPSCNSRRMADDCKDAGGRVKQEPEPKLPLIWWTILFPESPCANCGHGWPVVEQCRSNCRGYSHFPDGCAPILSMTRSYSADLCTSFSRKLRRLWGGP